MSTPASAVRRALPRAPGVAVALAFLILSVPVAASATPSAPSVSTAAPVLTTWAYGALEEVAVSGTASSAAAPGGMPYAYQAQAIVGFALVINETHPSANVYIVNVTRVMGSVVSVTFCRPSCSNPTASASISHRAWERVNSSATLLTNGSVLVGLTSVPALALASSTLSVNAGLRESTSAVVGGVVERAHDLSVRLTASDHLSLTPPLGLFPLNLTPGETWTSAASFVQNGSWTWTFLDQVHGARTMPRNYSRNASGSFLPSGSVAVSGTDAASPVALGGSIFQAINLSVVGPFLLREGWILVPLSTDVFGTVNQTWLVNQSSFSNATQANLDVADHVLGGAHLGIGGSAEWWYARSSNPAFSSLALSSSLSPSVAAVPASNSGSNATYVQGGPLTPAQAASDQRCLFSGVGCPVAAGPVRGLWALLALAGGAAVVAVLVAALTVERRRRIPPPLYPNAALYPPGGNRIAPGPNTPERPGAPPRPPSDDDDDPLSHLW